MDDLDFLCAICGKELDGETVVVKKGLKSLVEASIKRKDLLHEKLVGRSDIKVHTECRQMYTRPTSIIASISTALQSESVEGCASTSSALLRSNTEGKFNFKTDCLLCEKEAIINMKSPIQYRKNIHLVATLEIKDTLLKKCDTRNDEWGENVKSKILNAFDLVAAEARYHGDCYKKFSRTKRNESFAGRPKAENASSSFSKLCEFIESNDECQYTLKELCERMKNISGEGAAYTEKHLKFLLLERFKDRVVFINISGRKNVLCLAQTAHKVIDQWYKERDKDPASERLRIVQAAAAIIQEDIQKMVYETNIYPNVNEIKSGGEDLVPESLRVFTNKVTSKNRGDNSPQIKRKRLIINHAIISAVRPRSFLSPVQIALALTLHRLYGSKHLIDLLYSMGICASYHESTVYQSSLISAGSPHVVNNGEAFIQHVFDNADANMHTLDGRNTFHALGGIQCITPATCVDTQVEVKRIQSGSFNPEEIRLRSYSKRNEYHGLQRIKVEDLSVLQNHRTVEYQTNSVFPLNFLWLSSLNAQPGWSGFMNLIMNQSHNYETTYILAVPFININPNNLSSVYTALCFAAEQSRKHNHSCIVTFDQPLFLKASEIVAAANIESDVSRIIVRLGGFHLLMSFMGAIGRIMEDSGLNTLWETVYGHSTVCHMIKGHAYARAVRAYMLTSAAIITVLREQFPELEQFSSSVEHMHEKIIIQEITPEEACKDPILIDILRKLEDFLKNIEAMSRTSKLWINLLKVIDIMLKFIFAERAGNWSMHLNTTIDMLPFFHAAGHLPYAKSAHLYAQQMINLESKLSEKEFNSFTKRGFFTVRRNDKFWSGTWTDMCIEQSLMRPMKAVGGLTHGRGISESTLSKWILGTPAFLKIHEALEEFLGTSVAFTEQHTELRESRKGRDQNDISKFTSWLRQHNPFTKLSGELVSLSSGLVSDESVNCDRAYEIGVAAIGKMTGKNFGELKLRRKDMVQTQAAHKSLRFRSNDVIINQQQLFNRILCVCDSPLKLKQYFQYELASRPPSLFDEVSLRKGTKSSVMKAFEEGIVEEIDVNNGVVVIDGGFLLHYVCWPKNCTFKEILLNYTRYVLSKYGENAIVVFDGYPDYPTTKQEEQNRRAARRSSSDIIFTENTQCTVPQDEFLTNKRNKKRLAISLELELQKANLVTVTAEDDADVDIVKVAIDNLKIYPKVLVVGTDSDLLVLMVALAPEDSSLFFSKPRGGKNPSTIFYSIRKLINIYSDTRKLLLYVHSVTGCDTTSSFFGLGKVKAIKMLKSSEEAKDQASIFIQDEFSKENLFMNGEKFILALYGLGKYSNLNEARYFHFRNLTGKSSLRSNFDLAKLPPTSDAAYQHLMRVYLQVQKWLGNKLVPTEWGWKKEGHALKPIATTSPAAPDELLILVSCSCKSGCTNYCGCRKNGMTCSSMCEHCNGLSCYNSQDYSDENELNTDA